MSDLPPSTADLQRKLLAHHLKEAYGRRRAEQTGRSYRPMQEQPELWDKAAQLCQRMELSPEEFIAAAFWRPTKVAGGPYPNMLAGPYQERLCQDYRAQHPADGSDFVFQLQQTSQDWQNQSPQRDPSWLASPLDEHRYPGWTRVVLAQGATVVLAQWSNTARVEIFGNPRLQIWLKLHYPEVYTSLLHVF